MHASVRGQCDGCQHDAGSMQFRCARLIGVLDMIGISPEHGITGTASRGDLEGRDWTGSSLEPVSSASMKHRNVEAEVGVILPHAVQDHGDAPGQCNHRALGTTPARDLRGPCSQSCRLPAMHHHGCRLHRARRRLTSPELVIPPEMSRSPDWFRDGVRPTHGPTFFEEVNRAGSSTADR